MLVDTRTVQLILGELCYIAQISAPQLCAFQISALQLHVLQKSAPQISVRQDSAL